jgi:hypothetical protein
MLDRVTAFIDNHCFDLLKMLLAGLILGTIIYLNVP